MTDFRFNADKGLAQVGKKLFTVKELRPKSTAYRGRFAIFFQTFTDELVRAKLGPVSWNVLFWTLAELDHRQWRPIYQERLVRDVGCSQPSASRALKALVECGWLERRKDGRTHVYRLNIDASWRGNAAGWHVAQRERSENTDGGSVADTTDKTLTKHRKKDASLLAAYKGALRRVSRQG